ncbi:type II secretion system minor pseudopilin GspI [Citrobacter cronae]|uniref:type II secretion system minor pseudopilin GspI n=1 Tax=Citrobacter cronae TaxID=1748967 RepID=UPI00195D6F31|nr:type II secretion system minor pseudopilin GspI [Citrobacter cronae]
MKQQSGMLLLEVLLAMAIFATAVIGLISSMQWQLSALETLKQETLALWVADNALIATNNDQTASGKGQTTLLNETFSWQLSGSLQNQSAITQKQASVTSATGRTLNLYSWTPENGDKK